MQLLRNVDLQPHNTLGVPSRAQYLLVAQTLADLHWARDWADAAGQPIHIVGGGSNLVFGPEIAGLTLQVQLKGREIRFEDEQRVILRVGAGESWHDFVSWCLASGFYGLENLALIPGTVGASPVQNIGAYGVEVAQVIEQVEGVDLATGEEFVLSNRACSFGYRDSVFKRAEYGHKVITRVHFQLLKHATANLTYPALAAVLVGQEPTPANIFDAVCRVRASKLPDPAVLPNCGSFFKNPVVDKPTYELLAEVHPAMPSFTVASPTSHRHRKLAAAWLIDQCGWKGKTRYGVSVHHAQALVLTNAHRCGSDAVLALARDIQVDVQERFAVSLELEPRVLDS